MRIAIPHWQDRVSPVFDSAGAVLLVEVEDGREVSREKKRLAREDAAGRAAEVSGLGAKVLICGAISAVLEARLASAGVRVIGFVCGGIEEVLGAFLDGRLAQPDFRMPGCGAGRRRSQGGGGRERGRMSGPFSAGPGGMCVCLNCGHKAPHAPGQPCNRTECPRCGAFLTRI